MNMHQHYCAPRAAVPARRPRRRAAGRLRQARRSRTTLGSTRPKRPSRAFVAALEKHDMPRLQGAARTRQRGTARSSDAVQDAGDRAEFLAAYAAKHVARRRRRRPQGPRDRRGGLADADPDREARRQVGVRRRGGHRRDDLPSRRRQRARRHRRVPRLRGRTARVRIGRPRRRPGRHLRAQADQRRGPAQRPVLADGGGRAAEPGGPVRRGGGGRGLPRAARASARRTTATTTACSTPRARMPTAAHATTSRTAC